MDSSSSSKSWLSVSSASPGSVVLLYSVGAQGSEARGGPERGPSLLRVPSPSRPRPRARDRGSRLPRGGAGRPARLPRQRCIPVSPSVSLFKFRAAVVPPLPFHSSLLFPSPGRRAPGSSRRPGPGRGNRRLRLREGGTGRLSGRPRSRQESVWLLCGQRALNGFSLSLI